MGEASAAAVRARAMGGHRDEESGLLVAKEETEPSMVTVTIKNFLGGLVGGTCEAIVGYPLELVKARMQTQVAPLGVGQHLGTFQVMQRAVHEGGVSSLYRGASPTIFRSAISASVLFGLMGQYRHFYSKHVFRDQPLYSLVAAGVSTGMTESLLYTPFEVVKLRMQTMNPSVRTHVSNWSIVREVYMRNGFRGLYRGTLALATRESMGNVAYFVAYEGAKRFLFDRFVYRDPTQSSESERIRRYEAIATAGGFAGFMYWIVVFPVDTIKSVIQTDSLEHPRYKGMLDCSKQLYREGGLARFFRGISPSLIRAFPANATTFLGFEACLSFLNQHF